MVFCCCCFVWLVGWLVVGCCWSWFVKKLCEKKKEQGIVCILTCIPTVAHRHSNLTLHGGRGGGEEILTEVIQQH